ncbi:MAG TPA: cyclase family protein [Promineifilum sp.]
MTLRYYDISRTLFPGMAVWPGDTPFELQPTGSLADGDSVNLTTLVFSAHTGTHMDAPYHFAGDGETLEKLDLSPFWGPAQVVTVDRQAGVLMPDDLSGHELGRAPRLLVNSGAGTADPRVFHHDYVYPGPELAGYLARLGIILYGTDAPSMDVSDSKTLPGHHALHQNGISILEGLDLSEVVDGLYELVALPLKILGGDGCPVRAVLRSLE